VHVSFLNLVSLFFILLYSSWGKLRWRRVIEKVAAAALPLRHFSLSYVVSERRLLWDYKVSINGVVCYPDERYLFAGLMYLGCITESRRSAPDFVSCRRRRRRFALRLWLPPELWPHAALLTPDSSRLAPRQTCYFSTITLCLDFKLAGLINSACARQIISFQPDS
jgi:hypothetical protein